MKNETYDWEEEDSFAQHHADLNWEGANSRCPDPAGSLLSDTDDEIRKLRSTGDPVFIRAAEELRQAANYAFPDNKN